MTDPRITVIVITHNRRDDLLHTLGHLARIPERPAVIVVDNRSADGTSDAVRRRYPAITLLTLGRNLGAVGRNLAARQATTPYLAFCDDDSWWHPGSLAGAADLLDAHPTVAAVTARIVSHPHPDDPAARGGSHEDPIVPELRDSPLPTPAGLPGPVLGSFLAAATVIRADAFRSAGGFSPRLVLGGEEELLAADLAARGWRLCYVDRLTAHHRASPRRDPTLRRRRGIRNTLWFTWLRRPWPTALRRTTWLAATVPRDSASARAFAEALRGLPWVLRERRPLPPDVERGLKLLADSQRRSTARRYHG
ncbi:glycosyltransferase family 2 protein [Streptomyces sp. SAJ15]|uniref:glycosyltransferase family 2 protein n=1 Tax=Streptomyces sp. SAJ15 TaxID=2011095 RepID=UPI001186E2D8|nr:glycosyltransferase [Streptomyces sp. SAJ15]TVL89575.1 glycosyl transferase [Streptomyces sp. SAJ15]